jgi:hypothetical protein
VRANHRRSLLICVAASCALPADRETGDDTVAWELPAEAPRASRDPELPRAFVDTRYVAPTGNTITVRAGGNVQSALDAARPGDVILLEAGATFVGNFTLPAKAGAGWITLRSSTADANLPPEGTRITPAFSAVLPKLVSPTAEPALRTAPRAHHYRVVGVELTVAPNVTWNFGIVALGDGTRGQNSLDEVPTNIILDRVYIHGHPALHVRRCVALNSAASAVIDSYLSECHTKGFDSQAICGWNGPGPFKIVNNYLEGAGENVMFGGGDPAVPNLTPSDIEIRRNHFSRPVSWKGVWTVKNLFELKHAQRVLVEGNVFENNWADAQNGFAIVLMSYNEGGKAPWSVVRDVTFRRNRVRNSGSGITISARPGPNSAVPAARLRIVDNIFDNINVGVFAGQGRLFQLLQGVADVTIEHNTALSSDSSNAAVMMDVAPPQMARFVFRNNVMTRGQYGFFGSGAGEGLNALTFYAAPGFKFERNVIIGPGGGAAYPANNSFPATIADVDFMNHSGGNYRLAARSPHKKTATDGTDPGADIDAVETATRGVVTP